MPKISIIPLDRQPEGGDLFVGTSVNNGNSTMNFSINDLAGFYNSDNSIDTGKLTQPYTFEAISGFGSIDGSLTIPNNRTRTVSLATITQIVLSNNTANGSNIRELINYLDNKVLKLQVSIVGQTADYAFFNVTNVEDAIISGITNEDYALLTLEYITGRANGNIDDTQTIGIALSGGGGGSGTGSITIDTVLSSTSDNAVENRAIVTEFATKQDTITDLPALRRGAGLGTTSLQPSDRRTDAVNDSRFATAAQGLEADSALQPGDIGVTAIRYGDNPRSLSQAFVSGSFNAVSDHVQVNDVSGVSFSDAVVVGERLEFIVVGGENIELTVAHLFNVSVGSTLVAFDEELPSNFVQGLSIRAVGRVIEQINPTGTDIEVVEVDGAVTINYTGTGGQGPIGPRGPRGNEGDRGLQGIQGIEGEDGDRGQRGPDGDRGLQGIQGVVGDDGDAGDSAYQVAVDNGFVGTEAAWLLTLVGARGAPGADGTGGGGGGFNPLKVTVLPASPAIDTLVLLTETGPITHTFQNFLDASNANVLWADYLGGVIYDVNSFDAGGTSTGPDTYINTAMNTDRTTTRPVGIDGTDGGFPLIGWRPAGDTAGGTFLSRVDSNINGNPNRVRIDTGNLTNDDFTPISIGDQVLLATEVPGTITRSYQIYDGFAWRNLTAEAGGGGTTIRTVNALPGGTGPQTSLPSYLDGAVVQNGDFVYLQLAVPVQPITSDTITPGIYRYRFISASLQGWTKASREIQWNANFRYIAGELVFNNIGSRETPFRARQVVPLGLEPGVASNTEDFWRAENPYLGIEIEMWERALHNVGNDTNLQVRIRESNPASPTPSNPTVNTAFYKDVSSELDADKATVPEIIDASKWGVAPTGTKPSNLSWDELVTPVIHDDVTGEVQGGGVLGADFSHPAATNATELTFTFQTEGERDQVLEGFFLPQIRAIGPAPLNTTTARIIDRVVSVGTTQINVFFENGITVTASDFDDASIFLYKVEVDRIHKIEGGTYANGVLTVGSGDGDAMDIFHNQASGLLQGGAPLSGEVSHPGGTRVRSLLFTLTSTTARTVVKTDIFIPGTRALGPLGSTSGDASVIRAIQDVGTNQLMVTFEGLLSVAASSGGNSNILVYSVRRDLINQIIGGDSTDRGAMMVSGQDDIDGTIDSTFISPDHLQAPNGNVFNASPVKHNTVTGVAGGGQELGANIMHPGVTNGTRLTFTFATAAERDQSQELFFTPRTRGVGPFPLDLDAAVGIARVIPQDPRALIVEFESPVTLQASDDDGSNVAIYTIGSDSIHTVVGGAYDRGVLDVTQTLANLGIRASATEINQLVGRNLDTIDLDELYLLLGINPSGGRLNAYLDEQGIFSVPPTNTGPPGPTGPAGPAGRDGTSSGGGSTNNPLFTGNLLLEIDEESQTDAPDLVLRKNDSTPTTNGELGVVRFESNDGSGSPRFGYAELWAQSTNVTAGNEEGALHINLAEDGGNATASRTNADYTFGVDNLLLPAIRFADGTIQSTASAGIAGPQGGQGVPGLIGPIGMQGPIGNDGPKGDKGDTGDNGSNVLYQPTADGVTLNISRNDFIVATLPSLAGNVYKTSRARTITNTSDFVNTNFTLVYVNQALVPSDLTPATGDVTAINGRSLAGGGAVDTTSVENALGISSGGSPTEFLNEQGDFIVPPIDVNELETTLGIDPLAGNANTYYNGQGFFSTPPVNTGPPGPMGDAGANGTPGRNGTDANVNTANVESALGVSPTGGINRFYNQQGDFVNFTAPSGSTIIYQPTDSTSVTAATGAYVVANLTSISGNVYQRTGGTGIVSSTTDFSGNTWELVHEDIRGGGGSGDVTLAGDNSFTGDNAFVGPVSFGGIETVTYTSTIFGNSNRNTRSFTVNSTGIFRIYFENDSIPAILRTQIAATSDNELTYEVGNNASDYVPISFSVSNGGETFNFDFDAFNLGSRSDFDNTLVGGFALLMDDNVSGAPEARRFADFLRDNQTDLQSVITLSYSLGAIAPDLTGVNFSSLPTTPQTTGRVWNNNNVLNLGPGGTSGGGGTSVTTQELTTRGALQTSDNLILNSSYVAIVSPVGSSQYLLPDGTTVGDRIICDDVSTGSNAIRFTGKLNSTIATTNFDVVSNTNYRLNAEWTGDRWNFLLSEIFADEDVAPALGISPTGDITKFFNQRGEFVAPEGRLDEVAVDQQIQDIYVSSTELLFPDGQTFTGGGGGGVDLTGVDGNTIVASNEAGDALTNSPVTLNSNKTVSWTSPIYNDSGRTMHMFDASGGNERMIFPSSALPLSLGADIPSGGLDYQVGNPANDWVVIALRHEIGSESVNLDVAALNAAPGSDIDITNQSAFFQIDIDDDSGSTDRASIIAYSRWLMMNAADDAEITTTLTYSIPTDTAIRNVEVASNLTLTDGVNSLVIAPTDKIVNIDYQEVDWIPVTTVTGITFSNATATKHGRIVTLFLNAHFVNSTRENIIDITGVPFPAAFTTSGTNDDGQTDTARARITDSTINVSIRANATSGIMNRIQITYQTDV